jgi:hypothetical protein
MIFVRAWISLLFWAMRVGYVAGRVVREESKS